jgi:glycosyltransferase involved in cell wall biosynthesis
VPQPSALQVISSTARRGAETFAVELERELETRGHVVETWALQPGSGEHRLPIPTLGPSPFAPSTLRALRRRGRARDVVIAHGSVTLPAAVAALAGTGARIVYRNIGDPLYWSSTPVKRLRTRLLLSRTCHVVALVPGAATTLHDRFGLPWNRMTVIPNGADAVRFFPADPATRASARRRLGVPVDSKVAVWIGSLSREKNPELALDVAARLPWLSLLVVGDGPLRTELELIAGSTTRFLGPLADPLPAFQAADVALLTSDSEGLPAVLVEAGLCGLAAVATDVGYVGAVIDDGSTGILAPRGDAAALAGGLTTALHRRDALGAAARQRCVERYSFERIGDAWSEMLVDVLASRPG